MAVDILVTTVITRIDVDALTLNKKGDRMITEEILRDRGDGCLELIRIETSDDGEYYNETLIELIDIPAEPPMWYPEPNQFDE